MELIPTLHDAMSWAESVMQGVAPTSYGDSTTCPAWDLRTLGNHLVGGTWMFAGALAGEPLPADGPADLLGADPGGAYRSAAAALRASATEESRGRMTDLPIGTVPGEVALGLALIDTAVHAWDVAVSTGQDATIPDHVAAAALETARQLISDGVRGEGMPFAFQVDVDAEADPTARLVGFMGRTPRRDGTMA